MPSEKSHMKLTGTTLLRARKQRRNRIIREIFQSLDGFDYTTYSQRKCLDSLSAHDRGQTLFKFFGIDEGTLDQDEDTTSTPTAERVGLWEVIAPKLVQVLDAALEASYARPDVKITARPTDGEAATAVRDKLIDRDTWLDEAPSSQLKFLTDIVYLLKSGRSAYLKTRDKEVSMTGTQLTENDDNSEPAHGSFLSDSDETVNIRDEMIHQLQSSADALIRQVAELSRNRKTARTHNVAYEEEAAIQAVQTVYEVLQSPAKLQKYDQEEGREGSGASEGDEADAAIDGGASGIKRRMGAAKVKAARVYVKALAETSGEEVDLRSRKMAFKRGWDACQVAHETTGDLVLESLRDAYSAISAKAEERERALAAAVAERDALLGLLRGVEGVEEWKPAAGKLMKH
ncbi:hypothetical protein ACRALDRAFT_1067328 [Sodiomyces alcalophilus JCM 7366]|uniref:uncharacterized protein n=1 Tax=Sodiomyces alcalophilus JCM 7366 TaxID=591952 RepID=UPI0039B61221